MNTSIVIPVYNDPEGIRDTLDSLLEHTGRTSEIVVVDNDSTDHTPDVVNEYTSEYDHIDLETETEVQSSYAARNTGIGHTTGDVICFLDADVTVTDGWLSAALKEINNCGADYLAPDVRLQKLGGSTVAGQYNFYTGFPTHEFIRRHRFAPTACLFVTRRILDDVGAFDHRLVSGGDMEFGNRVYNAGYDLHYAAEIVVYHPVRDSLHSLVKRNLRIGRGHCQLQRYYPDRYGRVGIPPRPSGIHADQLDETQRQKRDRGTDLSLPQRTLFSIFAAGMTATRGIGYYRECLSSLTE